MYWRSGLLRRGRFGFAGSGRKEDVAEELEDFGHEESVHQNANEEDKALRVTVVFVAKKRRTTY